MNKQETKQKTKQKIKKGLDWFGDHYVTISLMALASGVTYLICGLVTNKDLKKPVHNLKILNMVLEESEGFETTWAQIKDGTFAKALETAHGKPFKDHDEFSFIGWCFDGDNIKELIEF